MYNNLIKPMDNSKKKYLSDESKIMGTADSISFPHSTEDVKQILWNMSEQPITYQGSNTGIEGFCVPHGGHIMNFSQMKDIKEIRKISETEAFAIVSPGVTLEELSLAISQELKQENFFWPPSPTEKSASIGGIISTGAYGMNSYHYGSTHSYVTNLSYIDNTGKLITLDQQDSINDFLKKNTTSNPIVELQLRLVKKPKCQWGITFFFPTESSAIHCADALQNFSDANYNADIISMEYIGAQAVSMVMDARTSISSIQSLPDLPAGTSDLIYIEIGSDTEDDIEELLIELIEIIAEYDCDPDTAWALSGEIEFDIMHNFRHVITELMVQYAEQMHLQDSRINKIGKNIIQKELCFSEAFKKITDDLNEKQLSASLCAHIKHSDILVDILPTDYNHYQKGKNLFDIWRQI